MPQVGMQPSQEGAEMPGPAPKPNGVAVRRNTTAFEVLPAAGRVGATPAWPLPDDVVMQVKARMAHESAQALAEQAEDCTDNRRFRKLQRDAADALRDGAVLDAQIAQQRELEVTVWDELWATPQAVMWERLAWTREVAQYVRWKVRGECGDLDAAKEARQWSDRLGLNPLAMLRLRLEIERADAAVAAGTERRERAATPRPKKGNDPRLVLVQ